MRATNLFYWPATVRYAVKPAAEDYLGMRERIFIGTNSQRIAGREPTYQLATTGGKSKRVFLS